MNRPLSAYEVEILQRAMVTSNARLNSSILDAAVAEDIAPEDPDWHHIRLSYREAPWKGGGYSILADWSALDLDGGVIELLVLGDEDGRPYELEIRRPDLRPIDHLPTAGDWR